jgi:class 3 adenylate cyclase/tetratricopeptide (TPR) repeat protein
VHCPSCGAEATALGAECSRCGAQLPCRCAACGSQNAPGANYCSHCGQALGTGVAESAGVGYARAPSHLVERVLRSRAALEGERKQVTVLFADIRGSFGLIEGGDPEEVQALLDAVLGAMIEAVHRFEGTVNQVLGDGIMALFGAPVAHEDHAVRAAGAALAMQQAVGRLRDPSWQGRGIAPQIRVGLNSGDVLIRTVRNDLSIEYRAVGSTTHMAARMEQLATPGKVWLTAETLRLGRGLLRAHSLGLMQVKGVNEPLELFELDGVAVRTRFQAAESRVLSPLSGRAESLAVLDAALAATLAGESRAVVLSGEPGVGKSRLCYELLRRPLAETCRVLEAAAVSYGRATPHGVLVSLLRSLLGIHDDDGPECITSKAQDGLRALGTDGDQRSALVLVLLDVSTGDKEWRRLDPVQRLRRIEETLRELLAAFAARGPTVLLLEDLHWADAESLAFIRGLVERPLGPATLLLMTHRLELAPTWPVLPHVVQCQLASLPTEGAEALLQALVGGGIGLASLRRMLVERTGGNPFFIEESARSLVERGALRGSPGHYVLQGDLAQLEVPVTIEALIAARLDRLSPEVLEVLQAAAVIGHESPAELLRQVADLPEGALEARLLPLLQAELLYDTGQLRTPVYRFKHALIEEVAYRRLLRARRRGLHARVVEAVEKLYATRLGEHVERLAEHSYRAELWHKAAQYHQLACTRAANRWANAQAIAYLDRGLEVIAHLPAGADRDRAAVDLRLTALAPLLPSGDHGRMLTLLREAEGYARSLGDARRSAAIASQLAAGLWMMGQHEQAMGAAEQALSLSVELGAGEIALQTAARYNAAMVHHAFGDFERTLSMLSELVQTFSGPLARQRLIGWSGYPSVYVRTFAVSCCCMLGRFEQAQALFEEGRALADELDHPHSRTMILEEGGFLLLMRGEAQAARELLTEALAICERDEVRVMYAPMAARLGVALLDCGQIEQGRALLEDAVARKTYREAAHYGHDYLLMALSDAQLRTGDVRAALQTAREAEQATLGCGEHGYHVCALVQLAAALRASPGSEQQAQATYRQALQKATRLHMRPWVALAREGLAAAMQVQGPCAEARAELEAAAALWTQLGAPLRSADVLAQIG